MMSVSFLSSLHKYPNDCVFFFRMTLQKNMSNIGKSNQWSTIWSALQRCLDKAEAKRPEITELFKLPWASVLGTKGKV